MATISPTPVLSTSEAASELGVSERTLRRYIVSGLIGFHRLPGGHYRIPREAIAEFWSDHSPTPRPAGRRAPLVARPRSRVASTARPDASKRRSRLSAMREPRSYAFSAYRRTAIPEILLEDLTRWRNALREWGHPARDEARSRRLIPPRPLCVCDR